MEGTEKIKVAICDDHKLFREGLSFIIQDDPVFSLLYDAEDGLDLLAEIESQGRPDVLLLDIKMPKMDGLAVAKKLKEAGTDIKIIVLTMHQHEDYILHMLELGANGYLLKNASAEEVKTAIKAVMERDFYFTDHISQVLLGGMKRKRTRNMLEIQNLEVTERELEVLELIAREYTSPEIAEKLYISARTVESHRKMLLMKFEAKNTAGLVFKAIKAKALIAD